MQGSFEIYMLTIAHLPTLPTTSLSGPTFPLPAVSAKSFAPCTGKRQLTRAQQSFAESREVGLSLPREPNRNPSGCLPWPQNLRAPTSLEQATCCRIDSFPVLFPGSCSAAPFIKLPPWRPKTLDTDSRRSTDYGPSPPPNLRRCARRRTS